VTLVIRPGRGQAMRAAFFVWEKDGTVRANQSYQEFNFPDRLAGVIDVPSRAERAETRAGFRSLPPLPSPVLPMSGRGEVRVREQAPPASMPVFEGSQYHPSAAPEPRRWPWIVGILAVLVLLAVGAMKFVQQNQPPIALGLLILERDGQLQIQWDNTSRAILNSTSGTLSIQDGPEALKVPLSRLELAEGRHLYTRQGGDVEVRLEVLTQDGPLKESTRFLGRPPAPVVTQEEIQAGVENEALQQENEKLKSENAELRDRVQQLERMRVVLESRLGITGKQ
jgi:hypothetical protein